MSDQNNTSPGDDKPKNLLERVHETVQKNPIPCSIIAAGSAAAGAFFGVRYGKGVERIEWLNLLKSMSLDPTNPAEFPMILGKEAMKALIDGDTEVVRFTSEYHPYTFLVSVK
jgi:hypothetical protein